MKSEGNFQINELYTMLTRSRSLGAVKLGSSAICIMKMKLKLAHKIIGRVCILSHILIHSCIYKVDLI